MNGYGLDSPPIVHLDGTLRFYRACGLTSAAARTLLTVNDRYLTGFSLQGLIGTGFDTFAALSAESLKKTPNAMISRAVVGIRGKTLILNLPGSPRAVRENLDVILPVLPHALSKLGGDMTDCGN